VFASGPKKLPSKTRSGQEIFFSNELPYLSCTAFRLAGGP
jgi:hypothetical protein